MEVIANVFTILGITLVVIGLLIISSFLYFEIKDKSLENEDKETA